MLLKLKPGDRLHWLIWKSNNLHNQYWCVAKAINGSPIDYAYRFDSHSEAIQFVFQNEVEK